MFAPAVIKPPSPKQMSRLRNGHKVRVCRAEIEGEGMNLLVDPSRLNSITRCFDKGRGVMVQLSAEEISANREIGGEGIFGKKFDRLLKKAGIKKAVFQIAEAAKPVVKQAMKQGLAMVPPQYQPVAGAAEAMASAYMDSPTKYQSKKGAAKLAQIGAVGGAKSAATMGLKSLKTGKAAPSPSPAKTVGGMGLGAGCGGAGLYASRGMGVGARGSLLSVGNAHLPPAMQSQPDGANFHFSTQLPPTLAAIHLRGSGLYM